MDRRLRVETENFNRAIAAIGRVTDDPEWQRKVIDHEVTKILETTIQRTVRATAASIKKSRTERPPWARIDIGQGEKKYYLLNRYPNKVWRAIQRRLDAIYRAKMNAREFARQAWYELAVALGFSVKATAQTKAANIPGVSNKGNVRASRGGARGKYGIELENHSPLIQFSAGRQALFSAIVGRRKYFETTMRKSYMDRIKPLAERYGLKVN